MATNGIQIQPTPRNKKSPRSCFTTRLQKKILKPYCSPEKSKGGGSMKMLLTSRSRSTSTLKIKKAASSSVASSQNKTKLRKSASSSSLKVAVSGVGGALQGDHFKPGSMYGNMAVEVGGFNVPHAFMTYLDKTTFFKVTPCSL